ncbi:MAG: ABC transporter transmembrane domain-containing protein [Trueperaceae bacterium]
MFSNRRNSGNSRPPSPGRRSIDLGQLRRMLALTSPYRTQLLVGIVAIAVASLLGLALPLLARDLFNRAFEAERVLPEITDLNRITLVLLAIFLVQAVFNFLRVYLLGLVGEGVVADLRKLLYGHLLGLSVPFFDRRKTGEITSRLTADVATVQAAVSQGLAQLVSQSVTLLGASVVLLVLNARLTLVMLAVVPPVIVAGALFGRRLRRISTRFQDRVAEANADAEEALGGIRVVKSFTAEDLERKRYARSIDESFGLGRSRAVARALFVPSIILALFAGIALVLWYGGRQVLLGALAPGDLVAFLFLMLFVAGSLGTFTGLYSQLQEAIGASQRIFELLDVAGEAMSGEGLSGEADSTAAVSGADVSRESPSAAGTEVSPRRDIRGRVEFHGVSFAYGDRGDALVLEQVDLLAQPGEVIALVGPSGAGKSTLVSLLPRFYEPLAGRITLDGHDLSDLELPELRSQIAMVPQETHLFSGTVSENIRYGKPAADDREVVEAARAANADGFVSEFPEGYGTLVGERGVKLSGGQRQRLAIARALLKDPRILILDEATSSLDSESEALIQTALERLMIGRTTFVIAHRLATVLSADRIVVLDRGRIVQQGPHAALLAQGGLYRELYLRQFDVESLTER